MEFHGLSTGFGGYKFRLERFSTEPHPYKREFVKAYMQIIAQLREHYGNIPILCLYPVAMQAPVFSYYETIVSELNDPKLFLLRLDEGLYNRTTDLGAAWHPGYSGHRKWLCG